MTSIFQPSDDTSQQPHAQIGILHGGCRVAGDAPRRALWKGSQDEITSGLDGFRECDCIVAMKLKLFCGFLSLLALIAVGCVSTVSGGKTAGVPFTKDTVEGRYQKPLDAVYNSAREVISANGALSTESIVHGDTNTVKTIVGKVNQRTVYIRVTSLDSQFTSVAVQARTSGGGSDIDLAHELEKQIALGLVR
jgi:hypothetical protein